MIRYIKLVFIVCLLGGCVATGPLFTNAETIPPGKALVYIYRPHILALSAVTASFSVDEEPAANIRDSGYSPVFVTPGSHLIKHKWDVGILHESGLKDKPLRLMIDVTEGQTIYVRLRSDYSTRPSGVNEKTIMWHWQLEEIAAESARKEIVATHLERP